MLRIALLFSCLLLGAQAAPPEAQAGESALLEAYDEGQPLPPLPTRPRPSRELRWLDAALRADPAHPVPPSPFGPTGPHAREVKALLKAIQDGSAPAGLTLRLTGSQLLLWRWGQARVRKGLWNTEARQAWEDFLLQPQHHGLLREYALRHALCFALAEKSEARFAALKTRWEEDVAGHFPRVQKAFALLGQPLPRLRFWSLPSLDPLEDSLSSRGFRQLRLAPAEPRGPLSPAQADTAWIIPTDEGRVPQDEATLDSLTLFEARALAARCPEGSRNLFLAPSRESLENYGLMYFPALITLDSEGRVASIRMGDAAPQP